MIYSLPAPTQHGDSYRVTLSGSEYQIDWSWNTRSGRWWIDLSDDEGFIARVPAVAGFQILLSVTGDRRPPGDLFVIDLADFGRDPGLRDFGADFAFAYYDGEDG